MIKWADKDGKEYVYKGHFNFKNQFHGQGINIAMQESWLSPTASTLDHSLMGVRTVMVSTSSTVDYAIKVNTRMEGRKVKVLSITSITLLRTRESSIMICLMERALSMTVLVPGTKLHGSRALIAPSYFDLHAFITLYPHIH